MFTTYRYRKFIALILLVMVLGSGCVLVYRAYREVQVSYDAFLQAENRHMTSAVIPGIDQNPIRQELNKMLAESLIDGLTSAERLRRAERGIVLLKDAERQIDMTMTTRDVLIEAIADVREKDGMLVGLLHSYDVDRVTAIAEEQMELVNDIRGLSYRANFHTEQIFKRLITDGGVLTSAHVLALNELIPEVEKQFDQRSNLYAELESLHVEIVE